MKPLLYRLILPLLKGAMYFKRAIFWFGKKIYPLYANGTTWYRKHLGFYLYKWMFGLKKTISRHFSSYGEHWIDRLSHRGTLQLIILFLGLLLTLPHSRFYIRDKAVVPGQETLLFSLAGPGYADLGIEEVAFQPVGYVEPTIQWSVGAVRVDDQPNIPGDTGENPPPTSLVAGGTALTKPTIMPGGAQVPTVVPGASAGPRGTILAYTVVSGDVIGNISKKFNISIETILTANNLGARSIIRPGDTLTILPVDGVQHTVKKGETISKIAQLYAADSDKIIAFNNLRPDGKNLVVGRALIIPEGVPPRRVQTSPQPSRTQTATDKLRSITAPPGAAIVPGGATYIWPAGVRRVTQRFGFRHTGVDIAGPVGTPLYASRAGTVVKSQCGWNGGYGCYVIISHGGGLTTLYGHASALYVKAGDEVEQGQTIAAMGSTGNSTGPHIHFEVRVGTTRQNPLNYIK